MFVSHARVRIVGLGGRSKKRGPHRRRLAVKEVVKMPCLLPITVTIVLGLMAVAGGAGMSAIGYVPSHMTQNMTKLVVVNGTLVGQNVTRDTHVLALKICSYIGPIIMALGMFAMIMACVFYCEILDKYAILVPDSKASGFDKKELYEVIVGEMKKSYAQTLITIYSKAAERNLLLDNQSVSGDLPGPIFPRKPESLTLEQQIDIECEGYTPSPPVPNKSYSVIQARIQRLRSEDNWLKTSSLPNILRSASLRRSARVGAKMPDSRTLSYDYTMDEARLRRKSMMLRSIVHCNSGSSDVFSHRQRRFSSVKALPSDHRRSLEDLSQPGSGSFPLTRLIQRRGTFACGDMRTRRMKFLLLLEASESQDGVSNSVLAEGRAKATGIRRNSFVPYTTCDRFIAGEERKTVRDRRRSSVNPFSFGNRFGNTIPQPGARRHSFFPIRRDDKILVSVPNEQRRHSFNPVGVNNTLKPEFMGTSEARRGSLNPEGHPDKTGDRRSHFFSQQTSRFLQVPGFDPYMEGRPSDAVSNSEHSFSVFRQTVGKNDTQFQRRHSFNPVVRLSSSSKEETSHQRVPIITINEDLSPTGKFLMVPSQDFYMEERERRHSFKTSRRNKTTHPTTSTSHPTTSKSFDKAACQRISFKLGPIVSPEQSSAPFSQNITKLAMKALKPTSEPANLSSYCQEMVVIEPQGDSRSLSPCSNVSCCGSERLGSEQSTNASRTESTSTDHSTKTILTVSALSVVPADLVLSYGTFQSPVSSSHTGSSGIKMADTIPKKSLLSPVSADIDLQLRLDSTQSPSCLRKSNSVRGIRDKNTSHHPSVNTDSPGSTTSGPAILYPSAITHANSSIQRSKSASALPRSEVKQ